MAKTEKDDKQFGYISRAPKKEQEVPQPNHDYLKAPIFVELRQEPKESLSDKLIKRAKHNPFVIGGFGLTTFALVFGVYQLRTGNDFLGFRMQQLRIAAQSFTIIALVAGEYHWRYLQKKKREDQALQTESLSKFN